MARTSSERLTAKDPGTKLAHRRMTVLELAQRLGNVSEACRRGGMNRTSFYDWKRRFELHGLEGLKDLPPIHKSVSAALIPWDYGLDAGLNAQGKTRVCGVWKAV